MFTGLVEATGVVVWAAKGDESVSLRIGADDPLFLKDLREGDSVSVNGVCLTAVNVSEESFEAVAVAETLSKTTVNRMAPGTRVNLEPALAAFGRFGGHLVQGHVDGVASVSLIREEKENLWVTLEPPFELMRYIVEKGSVCLDGISLTVTNAAYRRFSVTLIPHTRSVTTCREWREGTMVNLEVDIIAKYVERMLDWRANQ